jgi:hypothetical protein
MSADLLERDHEELGGLFEQLFRKLDADDAGGAFDLLDLLWARLAMHIRAEHLWLFPAILEAAAAAAGEPSAPAPGLAQQSIARLKSDHDFFMREMARAVTALRPLKSSGDRSAALEGMLEVRRRITAVCEHLEEHNRLEEEEVYKWTGLLNSEQCAQLGRSVRREIENMPPRFQPPQART